MAAMGIVLELDLGPLAPDHISEVIAGALALVLLWLVFAKFVSPAFEKMFAERRAQIEGGIMRAEQAEAKAEAMRKEYEAQLDAAAADAARVRDEARAQGAALVAQAREQAGLESARLLETARNQISSERSAAADSLRQEVGGLATTLAGRIVGESLIDPDRAHAAIDAFLDELAAQPAKDTKAALT